LFCGGSFHREAGEVETMTKAELVEDVARAAELTKKDAERLVEIVFESIIETLNHGEKIELRGFGSFRVRERGARRGRNPKTGDPVDIPAKRVPYFKPGKELKELINEDEDGAGGDEEAARTSSPDTDARGGDQSVAGASESAQPDAAATSADAGEAASSEGGEAGGEQTRPPLM
jgi:integration host factor subunit beta